MRTLTNPQRGEFDHDSRRELPKDLVQIEGGTYPQWKEGLKKMRGNSPSREELELLPSDFEISLEGCTCAKVPSFEVVH